MERVIKFRAWDKKEKRMRYKVEWIWTIFSDENISSEKDWIVRKNDLILMQFTGLHDKNGKEIYEGDKIVGGDVKTVSEVYWRNGGFGIKNEFTEADPDSITFINLETCVVIGTIFDKPNQSKKEKR